MKKSECAMVSEVLLRWGTVERLVLEALVPPYREPGVAQFLDRFADRSLARGFLRLGAGSE
jgi:hypothetical protein